MPAGPSSVASASVSRLSAALLGAYVEARANWPERSGLGGAESAMTVAMFTIQPAPRSRIAGTAALASR